MALFTYHVFDVVESHEFYAFFFLFSAEAGERVLLNCFRFPFLFFPLSVDDEE